MSNLLKTIENDLKDAMRNKQVDRLSTLRLLKSAVGYLAIEKEKTGTPLSDEDVIGVIKKQIKQRHDSITSFESAGRAEMAAKERAELAVLESYLPQQMSQDELKKIVQETIQELNATSKAQMGQVMKAVMAKTQGRADGKVISQIVNQSLA